MGEPIAIQRRRHVWLGQSAALAGAYYLLGRAALSMPFLVGNISPLWPPAGLAVAALFVFGRRLWPGVAVGALLVNGLGTLPLLVAGGMAVGNTLEALVGAHLLRRVARFDPSLRRVADVVALGGVAGLAAALVGASIGVASLRLGGVIPTGALLQSWRVWWLGDALGVLVVAPLVLTWTARPSGPQPARSTLESVVCGLALVGVSVAVFAGRSSYAYLVFPLLGWAAVRLGPRAAASATVVVTAIAVGYTTHGSGPFAEATVAASLWVLDTFVAMVAIAGLIMAAVVAERDRARDELQRANIRLDGRVREQTAALREDAERMAEAQRTARLGSWEWNLATDEVTWSDEMYRLHGLEPQSRQITKDGFLRLVHPDDRRLVEDSVRTAGLSGTPLALQHRITRPDGSLRWLRARGRVEQGEGDGVLGLRGTSLDITDQKHAEQSLEYQAGHDPLTGLVNRTLFADRLDHALSRRDRAPASLAVFFIDIDHFKWINDSLGHTVGDRLLVEVAKRLEVAARVGDSVARFGGDEFVMLCEDLDDEAHAAAIAQRLADALSAPLTLDAHQVSPTASIGIALASAGEGESAGTLLRDADAAMYRAKEGGRNRCEIFDCEMRTRARLRLETKSALRTAIDRGAVMVHYQPEIDLATDRVVGVEALARWEHPSRGWLTPDEFIPLAEETGLIVPLGTLVLEEACRQVAEWNGERPRDAALSLAVNLSARQLLAPDLVEVTRRALDASGLAPDSLCLEITESVLLKDAESSLAALHALKAVGVRLGLDDFGTGYASLTYLKRFPVDALKIDRSFISGLADSRHDRAIVSSVIDLAHAFGLATVGEGVETAEQLSLLRSLGCELAQGYLWSAALPADEFTRWLGAAGTGGAGGPAQTTAAPRTVVLVEDDDSVRQMLKSLFDGDTGYRVVGEATDGRQAVGVAAHCQPDLILLDLSMPGMGGMDALPLLLAVAPTTRVVVLTGRCADVAAHEARSRGAAGYFEKGIDPVRLMEGLTPILAERAS